MAEVYLGTMGGAEGFEKPVAIKRILPHLAQDDEMARMFLAEARLASFLSHQNIVQVFDIGRGPDGLFIVMELIDGWDLALIIARASENHLTLPPALSAFIASQVLTGLCHAYRQSYQGKSIVVAHRDISPSNVLISAQGEVKMGDFGIARLHAFHATESGLFKGKIAYSAPEVLQGEPATVSSDQFSLGIVLHEMLTGRHPFGAFENSHAYATAIVNGKAAEIPDAPRALVEVVMRALEKAPSDRFKSPEAFAKALAQFLASTGTATTTHEVADFLRSLALPPAPSQMPLELPGQSVKPGSFSLQRLQSIPSHPVMPIDATAVRNSSIDPNSVLDDLQSAWVPMGAVLDPSGQIAHPQEHQQSLSDPLVFSRIPDDQPLELDRPLRSLQPLDPLPPPRPRKWGALGGRLVAALLLLVAVGLSIAGYWLQGAKEPGYWLQGAKEKAGLAKITPILRIDSEPQGATIQIGDERVGQTPLYLENIYPPTRIEVSLNLKGYQSWKGSFSGGEKTEVVAKLRRRP
jgi:serine/threonine-protein kinase